MASKRLVGQNIKRCLICWIVVLISSVGMLVAGAFLPQENIDHHLKDSILGLVQEGNYYRITPGGGNNSVLDNYTEAHILMNSATMRKDELSSVFSNPLYLVENDTIGSLNVYFDLREKQMSYDYYVRYWMGFRTPVRILLSVLNYSQIRVLLGYSLLAVFALTICLVCKSVNAPAAFLYAMSFILVYPQVISFSIDYSCCFFLAMLAMICAPWIQKRKYEVPFFLALGMLTMYFDFYTTPLVTIGYPLLFMMLLQTKAGNHVPARKVGMYFITWVIGYGSMWVAKLALTTLFTDIDGFTNGFSSFSVRIGIEKDPRFVELYDAKTVLRYLKDQIIPDKETLAMVMGVAIVVAVAMVVVLLKDRSRIRRLWENKAYLVPVVMLLIWYIIAAEPTCIHVIFQYRTLAMAYWAFALYLYLFFAQSTERGGAAVGGK